MTASLRNRLLVLGLLVAVVVVGVGVAVAKAVGQDRDAARTIERARASASAAPAAMPTGPRIVFRSTAPDTYGLVGVVPLAEPRARPALTALSCDRIYATGTAGICLSADRDVVTTYHATLLDGHLGHGHEVGLAGIPSRARLSPDGRYAAATTFVSGHSYSPGTFSTATTLYDVRSGRELGNLETWRIVRNGHAYRSPDINVWGVSFTPDSRSFYVTVASKGHTWLSKGDVATHTIVTTDVQAECPSVAPDGRHVAFKRTTGSPADWRIWVLDLGTGNVTELGERHSIDDQVEWLDDGHVLYGVQPAGAATTDLWSAALDGSAPVLVRRDAWSPAVIR